MRYPLDSSDGLRAIPSTPRSSSLLKVLCLKMTTLCPNGRIVLASMPHNPALPRGDILVVELMMELRKRVAKATASNQSLSGRPLEASSVLQSFKNVRLELSATP